MSSRAERRSAVLPTSKVQVLVLLTPQTQPGVRNGFESCDGYSPAALFALSIGAVVDASQRIIDVSESCDSASVERSLHSLLDAAADVLCLARPRGRCRFERSFGHGLNVNE